MLLNELSALYDVLLHDQFGVLRGGEELCGRCTGFGPFESPGQDHCHTIQFRPKRAVQCRPFGAACFAAARSITRHLRRSRARLLQSVLCTSRKPNYQ